MLINKQSAKNLGLATLLSVTALPFMGEASATALFDAGMPAGWTCTGNCGTSGANGVVPLAPSGGTQYGWVASNTGIYGLGLPGVGGTDGSRLQSSVFSASAGDALAFQFNYVTSDGAGYADYAWSRLLDSSLNEVALLFTARTTPSGNSVPGFGMPAIAATISPSVVTITYGSTWAPLGGYSGGCWSTGCGHSGWVSSAFNIASSGNYILEFGVVDYIDGIYDSGLAFDGITIGGKPIEDIPEPASLALLGIGLAGLGAMRRRKATS
ncbi:MAG: NF038132 family protein [Nitrosomonadales bacterium]|nr:NF038132 family protein [Nitrosomonadales bacterium]